MFCLDELMTRTGEWHTLGHRVGSVKNHNLRAADCRWYRLVSDPALLSSV